MLCLHKRCAARAAFVIKNKVIMKYNVFIIRQAGDTSIFRSCLVSVLVRVRFRNQYLGHKNVNFVSETWDLLSLSVAKFGDNLRP